MFCHGSPFCYFIVKCEHESILPILQQRRLRQGKTSHLSGVTLEARAQRQCSSVGRVTEARPTEAGRGMSAAREVLACRPWGTHPPMVCFSRKQTELRETNICMFSLICVYTCACVHMCVMHAHVHGSVYSHLCVSTDTWGSEVSECLVPSSRTRSLAFETVSHRLWSSLTPQE